MGDMKHRLISLVLPALTLPALAHAEDAPADAPAAATAQAAAPAEVEFSADRPGYADGTAVVPVFRLQTEAGVTADLADHYKAYSLPDLLLRFGLTDWLEARLAVPTFNLIKPETGKSLNGLGDLGVGVKAAHAFGEALTTSLVADVSLPTGGKNFTSDGVDPEVELNVAYDATDRLSLGCNAKYAYATQPGEGEVSGSLSLGVGVTDDLGTFVEGIGVKPASGDAVIAAGVGATYMVGPLTQLDLSFTTDVSGTGFDKTIGAGVAVLW